MSRPVPLASWLGLITTFSAACVVETPAVPALPSTTDPSAISEASCQCQRRRAGEQGIERDRVAFPGGTQAGGVACRGKGAPRPGRRPRRDREIALRPSNRPRRTRPLATNCVLRVPLNENTPAPLTVLPVSQRHVAVAAAHRRR